MQALISSGTLGHSTSSESLEFKCRWIRCQSTQITETNRSEKAPRLSYTASQPNQPSCKSHHMSLSEATAPLAEGFHSPRGGEHWLCNSSISSHRTHMVCGEQHPQPKDVAALLSALKNMRYKLPECSFLWAVSCWETRNRSDSQRNPDYSPQKLPYSIKCLIAVPRRQKLGATPYLTYSVSTDPSSPQAAFPTQRWEYSSSLILQNFANLSIHGTDFRTFSLEAAAKS